MSRDVNLVFRIMMEEMTKKKLIAALLMFLAVGLYSQQSKVEERKQREEEMMKEIKGNHGPVDFLGRVIDQNGEAVSGAAVRYSYTYFCYGHELFQCSKGGIIQSDKNGVFEVKAENAETFGIKTINADGYDSQPEGRGFEGERMYIKSSPYFNCHENKGNPAIFKLRKKGEPTMLFSTTDKISFVKNEARSFALCFATYGYWYTKDLLNKVESSGKRIDLVASGRYQNDAYILTFKPIGDDSSGIILSDERLFSAPDSGYHPEVNITIKEGSTTVQKTLYLYVTSGVPPICSRVELNVVVYSQTNQLSVEYHSYTNPFGERNLEGGWHMYALKEYNDLEGAAKKTLKEGKYPPKPDFKALEEEGKKEYLKTHKDAQ